MTHRRALAAGLAVVVLWASAFPAIQQAVPQMGTVGLSFVRLTAIWLREVPTLIELAGGLLVLGGVVIVTRGPAVAAAFRRPAPSVPPPERTPET